MTQTIHYHKQYGKHGVASGTKSRHAKKNMPKDGAQPRKTADLRQLCHEQSKEIARYTQQNLRIQKKPRIIVMMMMMTASLTSFI